jgi:hypothetical protein
MVIDDDDGSNGGSSDGDDLARGGGGGDSTNAYLEAIEGEDGFTRDARGKVKFNKKSLGKRGRDAAEEGGDAEVGGGGDGADLAGDMADLEVKGGQAGGKGKKKQKREKLGGEFRAKVRAAAGGVPNRDPVLTWLFLSCPHSALEVTSRRTACRLMRTCLSLPWPRRRVPEVRAQILTSLARERARDGESRIVARRCCLDRFLFSPYFVRLVCNL